MNVSQLASRVGSTPDTVRHYTDLGLLHPNRNPRNGYREYGHEDEQRLRFALRARVLGFTLSDIRRILVEADEGQSPCPEVRRLIQARLEEVESEIERLRALSQRMRLAMEQWSDQPDTTPCGSRICGLIESVGEE